MKTTIFLDFDGVLHAADAGDIVIDGADWRAVSKPGFPPLFCHAPILWEIIKDHDVELVVHSTWRLNRGLEEIRELLPAPLRDRVVAVTDPTLSRFESIEFFVDLNGLEHYLVLDDDASSFPSDWDHLVLCDPAQGIAAPEAQKRIQRFLDARRP